MAMNATVLLRAVEAADVVTALTGLGISQTDLAIATGVDPKTVYAWKTGGVQPRRNHYDRLVAVRDVLAVLDSSLTPRGASQWLRAGNRLLAGRRPLHVLAEDGPAQVLRAAHAFVDGAYL